MGSRIVFALGVWLLCGGVAARGLEAQDTGGEDVAGKGEMTLTGVSWMAGCWEAASGDRLASEVWMAPAGGLMVGMSRSVRGDRATGYEFVLLAQREDGLVYRAHPSGQQPTDFAAVEVSDRSLVVSNPDHDFPRRIAYRLTKPDSLAAEVYGEAEGGDPAFVLRYARVACAGDKSG